jgi:hypothetical protein
VALGAALAQPLAALASAGHLRRVALLRRSGRKDLGIFFRWIGFWCAGGWWRAYL